MLFKRLVQAATAALALAAAAPGSAQQMLKVGSTPTGVPFTFDIAKLTRWTHTGSRAFDERSLSCRKLLGSQNM